MSDTQPIRLSDDESCGGSKPRILTPQEFARLLEVASHYAVGGKRSISTPVNEDEYMRNTATWD
jgi:hypothetical protein